MLIGSQGIGFANECVRVRVFSDDARPRHARADG